MYRPKHVVHITLANDQLDAQFFYFIIHLLQSSTCFEQRCAHHHEVKLYLQHLARSLSVSGRTVHISLLTCAPDGHLQRVTIPDAVLI